MSSTVLENKQVLIASPELLQNSSAKDTSDVSETAKKAEFFESDAGDGTRREDMYLHGKSLALCLISVFLCLFLFALDQLIVTTILSTVGTKFNALNQVGWLSSGFLISMAVLVAVWGKLSIIFGRKKTMIVAVVLFEAGSLMCALANSMNVLIGGRVLAGIGGGGIQTLVFIIITEILPINKRPMGMAILGSVFGIASVLGPLIGGAFTSGATWRWCFYINLPIGGFALVVFFFSFKPPHVKQHILEKLKLIDYLGVFLLSSGLVLILLALTFGSGGKYNWNSAAVILCFVLGGLLAIAFCVWNFCYSKYPIIPLEVVKAWPTLAASFCIFGMFGYFIASAIFLSLYFQIIHDASAWRSGVDLLPMIISVVISSISSGILVKKTTYVKPFVVLGSSLGMIGCGLLTLLDVDSSSSQKIGLLIPVGVGIGINMQASVIAAQLTAPKTPGGTILATSLFNFFRSFGGALSGILADVIYTSTIEKHLRPQLMKQSPSVIQELSKFNLRQLIESTLAVSGLSPEAEHFLKTEVMGGIRNTFYLNFAWASIGLIAGMFVTNQRLPNAVPQERDSDETKAETNEESNEESNEVTNEEKESVSKK